MPIVNVSFKNTTKDMKLYTFINSQEEKSEFVKKAIDFYLEYLEKDNNKSKK